MFVYPSYRSSAPLPPSSNCQPEPLICLVPLSVFAIGDTCCRTSKLPKACPVHQRPQNIKLLQTVALNATIVPLRAYHSVAVLQKVVVLDASCLHQYFELESTKYGHYSGSINQSLIVLLVFINRTSEIVQHRVKKKC